MRPLASAKTIQDTITRLHVQARQIGAGTVAARAHKRCLSIPEKERRPRSDEERRRFDIKKLKESIHKDNRIMSFKNSSFYCLVILSNLEITNFIKK